MLVMLTMHHVTYKRKQDLFCFVSAEFTCSRKNYDGESYKLCKQEMK